MRPRRALALAPLLALSLLAPARALEISVFHTNDIHGWVLPRPAAEGRARGQVGGMAVLQAFLRRQKGPRLLLDAGDWYEGTPEGAFSKGKLSIDLFNALGYDALEVGNHDFDFGVGNLAALCGRAAMPVLGANVYEAPSGRRAGFLKPWVIKDVAGVKVGVFGLLTTLMPRLEPQADYAGLRFRDVIAEARDDVAELRRRGATVIIALTHVGFEKGPSEPFVDDKALAAAVPGIDLIVGGHTHTYLKTPYRDPRHKTLVVQAGAALTDVGQVTLDVDAGTGKVVSAKGRLVPLSVDEYGEDAAIAAAIAKEEPAIQAVYDVPVATAAQALRRDRGAESPLGDWMADCARAWAGSDVAVLGFLPADLPSGPLTLRTFQTVMPFDNRLVKLTMSGRLLERAFDAGVSPTRAMMQVSGAGFQYDRSKPLGRRLAAVTVGGKPLDRRADYTVVTVDFLLDSGGPKSPFNQAASKTITDAFLRDTLVACARRQGTIVAPSAGRTSPQSGGRS